MVRYSGRCRSGGEARPAGRVVSQGRMAGTLATAESTVNSSLDEPVSGRETTESTAPQLDRIAHRW